MEENKKATEAVSDVEETKEVAANESDTNTQCEHCECEKEGKKEKKHKKKDKEIESLKEEIVKLQEELATTKNAYYKAYADTENLKKRLQSDADTLRKYRIQSFAQDILPAIDNLERALTIEASSEDMQNYINGINMIYQQLMTSLEREGVKVIEAKDKVFDPNVHQALIQEKVEGVESGMVVEEIQKGYMLKDRVLRATLVKVSE
ncbi:MAG: nucleotide exchange factor GrpE [Erysipelotrichia bacterium]|nr:nucleotide exchange factor GrpE [Erysipelotrichia bacterium]NCC55206.1 nucleotide exchange factor GrpE [Erysipelotrichia bacterium]